MIFALYFALFFIILWKKLNKINNLQSIITIFCGHFRQIVGKILIKSIGYILDLSLTG